MNSLAQKIGYALSGMHFILFVLITYEVGSSGSGQASLAFVFFALFDFPVSLLYAIKFGVYSEQLDKSGYAMIAHLVYAPYIIHGILGTIWWFFLPRFFLLKKYGGFWGSST